MGDPANTMMSICVPNRRCNNVPVKLYVPRFGAPTIGHTRARTHTHACRVIVWPLRMEMLWTVWYSWASGTCHIFKCHASPRRWRSAQSFAHALTLYHTYKRPDTWDITMGASAIDERKVKNHKCNNKHKKEIWRYKAELYVSHARTRIGTDGVCVYLYR